MTYKFKTPTPFWGRPCAHFGDGYGIPCPHFGDALSLFWGRFSGFFASTCPHYRDILNNHTLNKLLHAANAKQAGRQVGTKYRTDGQSALLLQAQRPGMVPMPKTQNRRGTEGVTVSFSLLKKWGKKHD